ncbi:hypothetical protein [Amycolatopsis alkalitolerans]|uniref:Uncharacterized protein n=1 Tax=Amycolatopsis alkalitolerans TaxID=2547244 RepID=A0A5C4MCH1_9PSEU|nr:hypothetical protein [Amycolatopsis alkalitolerans]TNC29122.1 hypothetical protein FG385_03205 [Amycolatopsis alkalitolerans]
MWTADNIWQLTARAGDFASRYGWTWTQFDFSAIPTVTYQGVALQRSALAAPSGLLTTTVTDPAKAAPRDSEGRPLEPFVSAAADGVADGTPVRITGCGTLDDGSPVPAATCGRLSRASWRIRDEFTPGLGGSDRLDVYLGPETGPGFTDGPDYVTLIGATVTLG